MWALKRPYSTTNVGATIHCFSENGNQNGGYFRWKTFWPKTQTQRSNTFLLETPYVYNAFYNSIYARTNFIQQILIIYMSKGILDYEWLQFHWTNLLEGTNLAIITHFTLQINIKSINLKLCDDFFSSSDNTWTDEADSTDHWTLWHSVRHPGRSFNPFHRQIA